MSVIEFALFCLEQQQLKTPWIKSPHLYGGVGLPAFMEFGMGYSTYPFNLPLYVRLRAFLLMLKLNVASI
jgi:hypothetical protein